jgi:magnesium-transporting ATPase (P-type)
VKRSHVVLCRQCVRAREYQDTSAEVLEQHLGNFAADGLRTLVLARKEVRGTLLG